MPTRVLIALLVFGGLLLGLLLPKVYVVRGSASGALFWNANEALLFMIGGRSGARMSYGRYVLEPFLVSMGHARQPNDERCSESVVLRVTDKGVQRYQTDLFRYGEEPYCGFHFDFFRGNVYAVQWPRLWKWTGRGFEPATPQEVRAFDAAGVARGNSQHPWEFDNVDGWSTRGLGQTAPQNSLVLNGQPVTIIFHGETWPAAPLKVELTRPGQASQTIWSFDGEPHLVSKVQYDAVFTR